MRFTKIIATLGPASGSKEQILALANAGVNIARINLSHGKREDHKKLIDIIKDLNANEGINLAILLDTKGSEIRTGDTENPISIEEGQEVIFAPKGYEGEAHAVITVNYDGFSKDVLETDRILVDNGELIFDIIEARKDGSVLAKAKHAGVITSRRHINLPGADIDLPSMTEKDWEDLTFGMEEELDFIALSFIRTAKEVEEVRSKIDQAKSDMQIITKIETQQAVDDIDAIIEASDGIMVARGDLGAEILFEKIPAIQDDIVLRCKKAGKPVIVATHMLESMIEHPMPTRAEVTDVAHAAVTQSDCTMLSGETAAGKHPILAVEAMDRILRQTEEARLSFAGSPYTEVNELDARAKAAVDIARSINAPAILLFTETGGTAAIVSRFRPDVPVIACTPHASVQRKLQLRFGIHAFQVETSDDPKQEILRGLTLLKEQHIVQTGERIVVLTDTKDPQGRINVIEVRSTL